MDTASPHLDYGPYFSDNPEGIPLLRLGLCAFTMPTPLLKWGTRPRSGEHAGTYHFYADDAKFQSLWRDPEPIVRAGVSAVVEPNFSTWPGMPYAEALFAIYRKRWLSRLWQSAGIRIVVDLNVDPAWRHLSLLGVPDGWTSYATRSHRGFGLDAIKDDWLLALLRAGHPDFDFHVFGGGEKVRAACERHGWHWIPEDSDQARGRNGKRIVDRVEPLQPIRVGSEPE